MAHPAQRRWYPIAFAVAALVLLPLSVLLLSWHEVDREIWAHLWDTQMPRLLGNTLVLVLGVSVGVVGLVENMLSGNAQRPGDVVRTAAGQTVEVLNTDAEGRLVLADVLWYTQDRFKPRFMVNLATLTGAIVVSLGVERAGLFSNNDELAGHLSGTGEATGEKLWRMPLDAAYLELLRSDIADLKNIGGRPGGSITAAKFLECFVNEVPWAHLDRFWRAPARPPGQHALRGVMPAPRGRTGQDRELHGADRLLSPDAFQGGGSAARAAWPHACGGQARGHPLWHGRASGRT